MAARVYIIRHGLIRSNKDKVYAGWSNEPLIPEAIPDVLEMGEKMSDLGIRRIISSPIRRAVQTAEILSGPLKAPIQIEEDLKEMKLGPWEGLSEEEVAQRFPLEWTIWNTQPSTLAMAGRETLHDIQSRALDAISRLSNDKGSFPALAVTHVALIRSLIIHSNKLSLDSYRKIEIPNLSVYSVPTDSGDEKMVRVF
jgi:alpha-ribazole phosphatase/probable phosphoglycerate mutase